MPSILIFDSGIGGLSILQHINQLPLPLETHYVADYAAYPYGEKEENWLIQRINKLIINLERNIKPDIIIIACNTASTLALPSLRSQLSTPIVGVIPAVKTASTLSRNKKIGLLATPGTVSRIYMDNLIEEFASDCTVTRVGSTELVAIAENKLTGHHIDSLSLQKIIQPFIDNQCDQVVLGCTHFPLLKQDLLALNTNISFVDSGLAIAKRTSHILSKNPFQTTISNSIFYSTKTINQRLKNNLKDAGFRQFKEM